MRTATIRSQTALYYLEFPSDETLQAIVVRAALIIQVEGRVIYQREVPRDV